MFQLDSCFADNSDFRYCCVQAIQYISDLGGVFGLWFGFALIAAFELFELFADLILLGIWRLLAAIGYA